MSTSVAQPSELSTFRATHAETLSAYLSGALGVDQIAEISYGGGRFALRTHVHSGPTGLWRDLGPDDLQALVTQLDEDAKQPPKGLDHAALDAFRDLLARALSDGASHRFDSARFGSIATDLSGAIVGHVGLGVDMIGTLHDDHRRVTFEQHVVPMAPGQFGPLSPADRSGLSAVLDAWIASAPTDLDPLWNQLAKDLKDASVAPCG